MPTGSWAERRVAERGGRVVGMLAVWGLFALLAAACGGGATARPAATVVEAATPAPDVRTSIAPAATAAFPGGAAVTVPPGYQLPADRVDSTGAYLPVNGKPTLVYVDAIW